MENHDGRKGRMTLLNNMIRKDFFGGGLLILIGSGAALGGRSYKVGTLMRMGPGFMPVALGVLLILLGIFIAGSAASIENDNEPIFKREPQWLPWLCIIASPVLFIIIGIYGGMIPATFACVFVAALADRTATLRATFMLATATTLAGSILFGYFLQIQLPLFQWG